MARAPAEPPPYPVPIVLSPMRRRHVRDVLGIERLVYPRPWSAALFFSELAQRTSRHYLVAYSGKTLVGYGGGSAGARAISSRSRSPKWGPRPPSSSLSSPDRAV